MFERHGYFVDTMPNGDGTIEYILEGRPCITHDQVRQESTPQLVRAFALYRAVSASGRYTIKPFARNRHSIVVEVLRERGVLD